MNERRHPRLADWLQSEHLSIRGDGSVDGEAVKVQYELCRNCGRVWRHS